MTVQRTLSLKPSVLGVLGLLLLAGSGCGDDALPGNTWPGGGNGNGGDGDQNNGGDGDGWNNGGDGDGWNPGQGGDGDGSNSATGLPCDIEKIVQAKCQTCHTDGGLFGAPMDLLSHEDFAGSSASDPGRTMRDAIKERLHLRGTGQMPPVAQPELTTEELAAFDAWLDLGAPASTTGCGGGNGGPGDGDGSDTGSPSGCADGECEIDRTGLDCYTLTAHAPGDLKAKYKVGRAVDKYYNFHFKAPWTGTVYGMVLRPIIDNKKVIHHWLLFQQDGGRGVEHGAIDGSSGTHPDGDLVHGWAPGGGMLDFRTAEDDVGFEFKEGDGFILEYHYNSTDDAALDASGVEICVQKQKPKNIAGVSWLGSDAIAGARVQGTCSPSHKEPIHILAVSPHMHLKGQHLKAVINRSGGSKEILHDAPFEFENQTWYERRTTLMPGESITTRCDYKEAASFGTATSAEMCYLFTVAYPKGALSNGDRSIHGGGSCLGNAFEGGFCGVLGQCIE